MSAVLEIKIRNWSAVVFLKIDIFKPGMHLVFKIDPEWIIGMRVRVCVFACVCPRPRLLITSGVIWHDMNLIRSVKQVLQLLYGKSTRYR